MVTLMILASGLNGPIPPGIASLTNLTDLRISDLSGNESTFPPISNITTLGTLIFRSCNIIGLLPGYIGGMTTLKVLDLSFNNLIGSIPDSFVGLQESDFIYLTGNSLTGPVPAWMLNSSHRIDLSYNNLTSEGLDRNCQSNKLNLFASSKGHTFGTVSCLRNISCQRNYSSLHINCGGRRVTDDNGTTYEEDTDVGGPADFRLSGKMWGFSNTGHFWDYDQRRDYSFIWPQNSSGSGQESQLYATARFSTLSLTYYAFCLINRNYTVRLHFSEIMMTGQLIDPRRGRRVFDVFIQGKRVLKDFNIENEAGGDYKEISKYFTAEVYDNTLDIRFYWGSRGKRNDYEYTNNDTYGAEGNDFVTVNAEVYGPLISAISVDPYDTSPLETGNSLLVGGRGISTGAKVGIAVAAPFIVFAVLAILWWKCHLRSKAISQIDLQGSDLQTGSFSLRQIREATNNFDPVNKIGEGGFGPVYKGNLLGGTTIAVKQLSPKSNQGNREFVNEIGIISAIQHPHLVKLYGCCVEENQLLLVYEYMENNSLARALFGPIEQQLHLDWPTRHKICIGVAKGLAYLHEESRLKIVHRDIKATNVLLDGNLIPKISDFGLAKLHEEDDTHISTRIAGTLGYMAPEYASRGYLTDKADVYSFGVVLLEIVSGRSNMSIKQDSDCPCLLDWVDSLKENQDLLEIVDPRLGSNFNKNEVMDVINVSILCTNAVAMKRPSMSAVVSILEGKDGITGLVWNPSFSLDRMKCEDRSSSYNEGASVSVDVPLTASSTSYADLYPISLNSDYLKKRRS